MDPATQFSLAGNVISLALLIFSELLGVYNGHGTCSSIIQLLVSFGKYLRFKPGVPSPEAPEVGNQTPQQPSVIKPNWML
jgi:hypothetical protein